MMFDRWVGVSYLSRAPEVERTVVTIEGREAEATRRLVDDVLARTAANAFKRALEPPYPAAPFYE